MGRPLDTSEEAYRRQMDAFRAMWPAERLRIADAMSTEVRTLAEAGIRKRRPGASSEEVSDELARLMLGPELAARSRPVRSVTRK
jgi:hypothetical protein